MSKLSILRPQGVSNGNTDLSERYAGEWDLNAGGSAYLVEAFPDPTKSTGYITISPDFCPDLFQFVGDNYPNTAENTLYDYVVADGTSTINSGIRSMKVNIPLLSGGFGNSVLFGVLNNNNTVTNLMNIMADIPSTASGAIFSLSYDVYNGYRLMSYIFNNGVFDVSNISSIIITNAVAGEPLYFDLNTDTGAMEFTITGNPDRFELYNVNTETFIPVEGNTITLTGILDLANFQTDTFAPYYGLTFESPSDIAQYASSLTFDLGTTDDGRLPFLSSQQVIEPPLDAVDGKVYKVVGNGVYLSNPPIYSGDYVEFSENIQTLIITRPAQGNAEISNIALTRVVEELEQGGIIYDAINEFNTQTIAAVNGSDNVILGNSSYVELSDGGIVTWDDSFVTIPINVSGNNLKVGQRLYIMSTFTSSSVYITTLFPANQIGLPEVAGVTAGVTYEYVIVRIVSNKAVWLRVK